MPAVARLGDPSDHSGSIITASETTIVNGLGVARNGDLHFCPAHGVTALISSALMFAEGKSVVRIGDFAGCGAMIIGGSPNTFDEL
jgi:uncharacterized Zn-binding protein involved in type VI secretion